MTSYGVRYLSVRILIAFLIQLVPGVAHFGINRRQNDDRRTLFRSTSLTNEAALGFRRPLRWVFCSMRMRVRYRRSRVTLLELVYVQCACAKMRAFALKFGRQLFNEPPI